MAGKKVKSGLRAALLAGTSPLIRKIFGRKTAKFGKVYPITQRKVTKEERAKIRASAAPKKTAPQRKETMRERIKRVREAEAERTRKAVE